MRQITHLDSFCEVASGFWRDNVLSGESAGERVILVEVLGQDRRVMLRNLTMANALRRIVPARLVVFSGADADWRRIWPDLDVEEHFAIARAYGASDLFDIHDLVDRRVAGETPDVRIAGVDLGGELPAGPVEAGVLDQIVDATTCRALGIPRVDADPAVAIHRARIHRRSEEFGRVYEALFRGADVAAVVTSHVDYDVFGLLVETARAHEVPVLFPQSTGGLKAYAMFPGDRRAGEPVRAGLTRRIGEFFEEHVWANREVLRDAAELTLSRSKLTLGRPSWWRAGRGSSSVEMSVPADRALVREHTAARLGLDADKPTIAVFNHAISDALGTNVEAFADLGAWFEWTVEYAAAHDEVNWLLLDHPSQEAYDAVGFLASVATKHADQPHLHFAPSLDLSKNALVALTDLAVTLRGSVSNEYPAFGIPALQAGWSEWSGCGFTTVTETPEEYERELGRLIAGLLAGEVLIAPEQIERARLWAWFYRSGTDVRSSIVPHWHVGELDSLFNLLSVNMLHVEPAGDDAFVAVRRLWERRDPFLTAFDWQRSAAEIRDLVAPVEAL